jgi:[NiFe] hydrogenase diaphorase moiety large subunit
MGQAVQKILNTYRSDRTRLIDMLWDIQWQQGYISDDAVKSLAEGLNLSAIEVRETLTFYHFFRSRPGGKQAIYLSNTVIAKMKGYDAVKNALESETACSFGQIDRNQPFGLYQTGCIGLSDQEPAMMIDRVVFTRLTAEKVTHIIRQLKQGKTAEEIANPDGLPTNTIAYVDALVASQVQQKGPVFFKSNRDYPAVLQNCLRRSSAELINTVTASGLLGRGGAGFPTGLKWRLAAETEADEKYIICNADEGEPGTFKDRVLLIRSPKDVLTGMVAAAYATGTQQGILYLRAEYYYLKDYLEQQIQDFRDQQLLGENILQAGFDFDIRIQMGAGAYVCGDETALIESCEGKRGTPRVKPPYPIQQGYLGKPTVINNVETLAAVSRIIEEGADWFRAMGTGQSAGTRLLSVSGDCEAPGIYEIEWGVTLNEVLQRVGAEHAHAVQISGPAGECLSVSQDGERRFCYSDLSCNGSLMIFHDQRDLLAIVRDFMQFFVDESCGICVPCRAGGIDLLQKVELIMAGRGCQQDLDDIANWGQLLKTSRCGLGVTTPNPLLTTLKKFPEIYQQKLVESNGPLLASFNKQEACQIHENLHQRLEGRL